MALFNTLKTRTEQTDNSPPLGLQVNSEVQYNHCSAEVKTPYVCQKTKYSLFDSLPHPVIVRDENGHLIFHNKAARNSEIFASKNCYYCSDIQQKIQAKAANLFQQNKLGNSFQFEIETKTCFLRIHQSLEQNIEGRMIIVETLKNITEEKLNKISLSLLSIPEKNTPSGKYLNQLTKELSETFNLSMVMIAITNNSREENISLSCCIQGEHVPNFAYPLKDNPCARIFETKEELYIPNDVQTLFPHVRFLKQYNFNAFYGIPLINPEGKTVGIVSIANQKSFSKTVLLKKALSKLLPKLTLIVDSKKHLRRLELQKAWTRQAINSYKAPICVFKKDFTLRAFNSAYAKACKEHYNIKVEKGANVLDLIEKNNTLTKTELTKRKELIENAFKGKSETIYISLGTEETPTHYALSFNPIFNYDNTKVNEALLIAHDTTEIIKSKKELEQVKKHYYSLFDNTLTGIAIYDSINKKGLDFNDQFLKLFGFTSKEEARKYQPGELSPEFQPNGTPSAEVLSKLSDKFASNAKFNTFWTHSRLDGTTLPSQTSFIPLNDEQPGLFCVAIRDLSEQHAHQAILEQKKHELEQYIKSNMQLENLAYSACHDLKEPLRTIGTFTQIIKNKYEDTIDEKSKEYMDFIVNGVTRMNHFVDGLFEYARVRENKNEFGLFSLTQLLEFIQLDLNAKERNVNIQFHNIPESIVANRTKIKQLFQNMIANAIKFQQADIQPEIKITCKQDEDHWHFSVTDNGIGIAEEFHHQVFTLFRKLHSKDQYEGSGIGLALCKEIVDQHQGDISVDSEPNKGTTFHFSLARNLK